jgi:hypothetical protein
VAKAFKRTLWNPEVDENMLVWDWKHGLHHISAYKRDSKISVPFLHSKSKT